MSEANVPAGAGLVTAFKRRWHVVLALTVLAGLGGWGYASAVTPTYEAAARVLVGPIGSDLETLRAAGQLAHTYSELARSEPLLASTVEDRRLSMTPQELRDDVRSSANDVTRILSIEVRSANPRTAAAIANTLAARLVAVPPPDSGPEGVLRIIERATPPLAPLWPRTALIVSLAALAGLLSALTAVVLAEYLRDTVQADDDLVELTQAPFLGSVDGSGRRRSGRAPRPLVVEALPESRAAGSYRLLAANLLFANGDRPVRSVLVVGAGGGDGSGEVTANLAATLAAGGRVVRLVDASRPDGEITRLFGLQEKPGLGELLESAESAGESLDGFRAEHTRTLDVVPCGNGAGVDVLELERAAALLDRLGADTRWVLLNAAPVRGSSSTLTWARAADVTVLVAQRGRTKRGDLVHAVENLRRVKANLVGTVARRT